MDPLAVLAYGAEQAPPLIETERSRPKSVTVKHIDIADILGHKYRYRIDIGKDDIDPALVTKSQVQLAKK